MAKYRMRRHDNASEDTRVVRGTIGAILVIVLIFAALYVAGNKYLNAAPTPANQVTVQKSVVGSSR